jgi:hypothetical protein
MASEVKAQTVSVEDYLFRLIATIGTPDLCLLTTPRAFGSRLQRRGCTKQLIKVEAASQFRAGPGEPVAVNGLSFFFMKKTGPEVFFMKKTLPWSFFS